MKRILLTSVLVPMGLAIGTGCAVDDSTAVGPGGVGQAGDHGHASWPQRLELRCKWLRMVDDGMGGSLRPVVRSPRPLAASSR